MAEYLIQDSTLAEIADAIRAKSGTTEPIAVANMAAEIANMETAAEPVLEALEITENGTYAPGEGVDGFSSVTVNVAKGGSDVEVVHVTFMSHDGATELHKRAVVPGNTCMCPVTGVIQEIETPTIESTAQYDNTFSGWSTEVNGGLNEDALKNVTEDRVVYAAYISTVRFYTVRFFDGNTQIGDSQSVAYGGSATAPTVTKDGYQFDGWDGDYTNITADTDFYAQWTEQITFANATWAQIAEISEAGEAANYFAVGDTKTFEYYGDAITVAIAGFNHDDLADGSGKAGISIICKSVPDYTATWNPDSKGYSNRYYYSNEHNIALTQSIVRTALQGELFEALPEELKAVIKPVNKYYDTSNATGTSPTLAVATDSLWLPSIDELGYNWGGSGNVTKTYASELGNKYDLFESKDFFSTTAANFLDVVTIGSTTTNAHYWTRAIMRDGALGIVLMVLANGKGFKSGSTTGAAYIEPNELSYARFGFCI